VLKPRKSPPSPAVSEYLTRKQLIDDRITGAGWTIVPQQKFDPEKPLTAYDRCAVEEYPTANGPADYALCLNGHIAGIVEAKKLTLGPQNVLIQAERYSKGATQNSFQFRGFHVPFLYATNGEVIWHHDIRHELNRSRQIFGFHTPEALLEALTRNFEEGLATLAAPNDHPRIRPYQQDASAGIEKALAERKRQMLVAMATGTGKTFTLVNEIYRLMKSGGRQTGPLSRRPARPCCASRKSVRLIRSRARFKIQPDLRGLSPAVPYRRSRRR